MEVFLGLPKPYALDVVALPKNGSIDWVEFDVAQVAVSLDQLRAGFEGLHREIVDRKEKVRCRQMAAKRGTVCNFDVGDFVLWSRIDERLPTHKLLATWLSPFRVIEARPHSFLIDHLVNMTSRGARLASQILP
jgi:hypothetical protein